MEKLILTKLVSIFRITPNYLIIGYCALFATNIHAELYKWVDADGNVNYTQSPPPDGIVADTIKPPPAVKSDPARERINQRVSSLDELTQQRQKKAEEQLKSKNENAEDERLCNQAKSRLLSYEKPRVSVSGADGVSVQLTEAERLAEVEKSRNLITRLCK